MVRGFGDDAISNDAVFWLLMVVITDQEYEDRNLVDSRPCDS